MLENYVIRFRKGVTVFSDGEDRLIASPNEDILRCHKATGDQQELFRILGNDGGEFNELIDQISIKQANIDVATLYYFIDKLARKGLLNFTLVSEKNELATLEPASSDFRLLPFDSNTSSFRLSRFACLRREGDSTVLECGLSHARLKILDGRLAAFIGLLSTQQTLSSLTEALPNLSSHTIAQFMWLMFQMGAIHYSSPEGKIAEDDDEVLQQWEFHDLLFHTRSRIGRHSKPLGGTFRFLDRLPLPPAIKEPSNKARISLEKPQTRNDIQFFDVLEARRSVREIGENGLEIHQLSEFLWHVARIKTHTPADPMNQKKYEMTLRPCPGGGAMHELEYYLTIYNCKSLEPGLYRYDPSSHELELYGELASEQMMLLRDCMISARLDRAPDVLITLAARFNRIAWKYESIAYATILKNVGVIYQQMYLVATALGLAPCALGGGNSDRFAHASGIPYFEETSVGEFALSSRK